MTDPKTAGTIIDGLIKWFDLSKGYGFIVNAAGGPDILLHANVLRNFGQGSIADNSHIRARVVPTGRGLQAVEILDIAPPSSDGAPPIADLDDYVISHLDSLPLRPARVKWFDKGKGFGFANIFGLSDDVFVHIEVLRHSGLSDLAVGEAVALRVIEGPRGLMAAQVLAWDRAVLPSTAKGQPQVAGDDHGPAHDQYLAAVAQ